MKITLAILAFLVLILVLLIFISRQRWRGETATQTRRLTASVAAARSAGPFDADQLRGLPEPVALYLSRVLRPGQTPVRLATFEQEGTFQMKSGDDGWRPFKAIHHASANPPGFVWDATIAAAPGTGVFVRDSFLDGQGSMRASLLGLVSLAKVEGTPDIAQGALHRYLAEAVWMPTALLPSAGVSWQARDHHSATARLRAGATEVALDFFFGQDGLVERVFARERARDVEGKSIPTPWQGRFSDYQERGGMLIPLYGEVEWILPEGPAPYWRGRLLSATYEKNSG